jgi:Protein of unknown function (DUF2569)
VNLELGEGMRGARDFTRSRGSNRSLQGLLLILAFLLPVSHVLADGGSSGTQPTPFGFGVLGFLIAYLSRKHAIGGWLLYYYIQLYISFIFIAFILVIAFGEFLPDKWSRSDLYVWFLLSWVPPILANVWEIAAATYLLKRRTEKNLIGLRYAIWALLITTVVSCGIDFQVFNDVWTLSLEGIILFFATIWLLYFYKSVRVRRVFVDKNWIYAERVTARRTPAERRYMLRRALLCAIGVYIVAFVLTGVSQGEKKPEPAVLFFAPLAYAVLVALVSFLFPIRKRKREALQQPIA